MTVYMYLDRAKTTMSQFMLMVQNLTWSVKLYVLAKDENVQIYGLIPMSACKWCANLGKVADLVVHTVLCCALYLLQTLFHQYLVASVQPWNEPLGK